MIIDTLNNASQYWDLNEQFKRAFYYLMTTDLNNISTGKYEIDGDNLFAIVQEYNTLSPDLEQMEAHKKYIDIQYMIRGVELVGHSLLKGQAPSKEYSEQEDFWLTAEKPSFFTKMETGTFMIFFPNDLHMPCIRINDTPEAVKKVVIKVKNPAFSY